MLVVVALLLIAYSGLCALLYFKQRSLVYYPGATTLSVQETDFSLARGDVTLRGWRINPGRPDAILYFGGNAERLEMSRDDFKELFPDRTVYLLAYRGYGASEGKPTEAALLDDALALYDQVKAQHPDGNISLIGRSLGSGVASYVAAQRPVSKLVLVTPFDSLADVAQSHYPIFPVRWLMRDRYESTRYLPRYAGPLLILRAGRDEVIPARNTDGLVASLARKPRVIDFPQAGHNDISADPGYGQALRDFLR
ncbi:MAG TPA: alpha/beta fold hydrolase [Pseudoxanthomonas sp.]